MTQSIPKPLRFVVLLAFLWLVVASLLAASSVIAERSSQLDAQQAEFIADCAGRGGNHSTDSETSILMCEKGARRPKAFEFEPAYPGGGLIVYAATTLARTLSFGLFAETENR